MGFYEEPQKFAWVEGECRGGRGPAGEGSRSTRINMRWGVGAVGPDRVHGCTGYSDDPLSKSIAGGGRRRM